jgi:hypothetical protein
MTLVPIYELAIHITRQVRRLVIHDLVSGSL